MWASRRLEWTTCSIHLLLMEDLHINVHKYVYLPMFLFINLIPVLLLHHHLSPFDWRTFIITPIAEIVTNGSVIRSFLPSSLRWIWHGDVAINVHIRLSYPYCHRTKSSPSNLDRKAVVRLLFCLFDRTLQVRIWQKKQKQHKNSPYWDIADDNMINRQNSFALDWKGNSTDG